MTTSNLRRFGLPALVVGGATVGSLFAPGLAAAQTADDADDTVTEEAPAEETEESEDGEGRQGRHHRARGQIKEIVTEILGLEAEEIREAVSEGLTLNDLAAQQDVDSDDLADALIGAAEERIAAKVEAGRIDEDQAAERLEGVEERVESFLNGERPERPERDGDGEGRRRGYKRGFGDRDGGETTETLSA